MCIYAMIKLVPYYYKMGIILWTDVHALTNASGLLSGINNYDPDMFIFKII